MKKPVVHDRNQSSIKTVLTLDAVGFYDVKIIALYLGEARKYRLDRELTIAINNSDIFAAAGVEPSAHIPAHRPFFWLGQHAHLWQPFGELPADHGGSVVRASPKIGNEDQFPFEAKQRHYLVKVLHERDDFFFCTITKYRDGKFDGALHACTDSWQWMHQSSRDGRPESSGPNRGVFTASKLTIWMEESYCPAVRIARRTALVVPGAQACARFACRLGWPQQPRILDWCRSGYNLLEILPSGCMARRRRAGRSPS